MEFSSQPIRPIQSPYTYRELLPIPISNDAKCFQINFHNFMLYFSTLEIQIILSVFHFHGLVFTLLDKFVFDEVKIFSLPIGILKINLFKCSNISVR